MPELYDIDFQPIGRRGKASHGKSILDAARTAGVGLASVCGGEGTCEECRVRVVSGRLTPPTLIEQSALSKQELAAGFRLACQAEPLSNLKLDIPPEALTAAQRLQLEGEETQLIPQPAIHGKGVVGLAVDVGTTKLAAYLVELETGHTLVRAGAMNPQIAYGEDVVSRIAYAGREPGGADKLHLILLDAINELVTKMCADAGIPIRSVLDAVLVGNTAMHHLLACLPVEQLGYAPFAPARKKSLNVTAKELGLYLGPDASVYIPPVIAGYVGADHIAMLLATDFRHISGNAIALDIGTNTEIGLVKNGKLTCCSCASGPAFEGAHIHEGMRAAPGAIERVRWLDGMLQWQTIENKPPVGICGSGILDVVAAFLDGGLLKPTGAFRMDLPSGYPIVRADQSGLERDMLITRKDIHEIQLAKSAIRAGIEVLLQDAGIEAHDLGSFIVAGAFGTYLDLKSAIRIGMFPDLPIGNYHQVGNAAGIGAKQMLISIDKRREAEKLASQVRYIELTSKPAFTSLFMEHLSFRV